MALQALDYILVEVLATNLETMEVEAGVLVPKVLCHHLCHPPVAVDVTVADVLEQIFLVAFLVAALVSTVLVVAAIFVVYLVVENKDCLLLEQL